MSRSNGPANRNGGQAPQWRQAPEPDQSRTPHQHPQHAPAHPQAWAHQLPDHQHGYYDPAGGGHPMNGAAQPQPGYHYPEDGSQHGQHSYAPAPGPAHYAPAPSHQPEPQSFDHYMNEQAQAADPYAAHAPQHGHEPAPSLRDHLRGGQYDQWQGQRDYDLGSYMPAPSHHQQAPGYGQHPQHAYGRQGDAHWPEQAGHDPHGYDPHGYYADGSATLPVTAHHDDRDDGDYDMDEPPTGKRRGLLIVVSLVGAIAVGGGLAYAYKSIIGPSPKGSPPVIKADNRPAKIQPAEPGGKQFAHSDMKLMGRLEPESSSASSSGSADPDNGVRRVSTVTIRPDGTISAPPPESRLPPPTVSVPGLTLVESSARGLPPPRMPEPQRTAAVAPVSGSPATPQIISRAPATAPQPAMPEPEAAPVQPKRQAALPQPQLQQPSALGAEAAQPAPRAPQAPLRRAPAEAAAPPSPKPAAATGGSAGYVAVLSSQRSRMDALKSFADLQQKYASVLQNKIPDVQEADLSARGLGTMYRAVVGPPGSREAANDICGQLKSAGYTGCWVTPY